MHFFRANDEGILRKLEARKNSVCGKLFRLVGYTRTRSRFIAQTTRDGAEFLALLGMTNLS